MISFLRGVVAQKQLTESAADRLVLDVGGVGFELLVARSTLLQLGEVGETATVPTSLVIRENDWTIYGFADKNESYLFNLLQSVSGVGPKSALALVGSLGAERLAQAISAGDHKLISQAPGIGTKTAQRLALDLKSKIDDWLAQSQLKNASAHGIEEHKQNARWEEVAEILSGLGYTQTEINLCFKQIDEQLEDPQSHDVEALVRHCLKSLGQQTAKAK